MAKTYTANWGKKTNAVSAGEFPLVLLEINRSDLVTPIRIVNDATDLTHNGNLFTGLPFEITLPDDPEYGMPQAQLSIMNVGKELTTFIEDADWTIETTATLTQVIRSSPNVAEWSITMIMSDIQMNSMSITAKLGFEDLLGVPAVTLKFSPTNAPGLY
jgi:hypothetical protein